MKIKHLKRFACAIAAGALLLGAVAKSQAQSVTTSITNTFDSGTSSNGWVYWYDIYAPPYNSVDLDWDGTMNNTPGHPGSGSILFKQIWPGTAAGVNGHGQNQIWGTFANNGNGPGDFSSSIDGSKYDTITFDIHANPGCPVNANGDICQLTVGFFSSTYSVHGTTNINIPISATNGWYHAVALVNKADAPTTCVGWAFNVNCYGGPNAILFTNTTPTYLWIDNVQVNRSKSVAPPPVLTSPLRNPIAGLNMYSSLPTSDQYQRTNLKLLNNNGISWVGQQGMTFSYTIKSFPNPVLYPGYQAHLFITTGPANNNSLDYGDPNLVWLNVTANADGTATAQWRYKINETQSNSNMFGAEYIGVGTNASAGTIASLTDSNVLGTWSMTFNNDTNVTVTGPTGVSTNFTVRTVVADTFVDPLYVAFGAQPNNVTNVGQEVILSSFSITNAGSGSSVLHDNFLADTTLDLGQWVPLTAHPGTVQLYPVDPGSKLVSWTLPDTGYGLQVGTSLQDSNSWTTLTGNEAASPLTTFILSGSTYALIPSVDFGPKANFVRLFTRKFTKLQILMPGETAAPGTASGKTGVPDPESVGIPFNVIVNAVDPNWNVSTLADDTVHLTSTDTTATLPADVALSGGTATLSVTFGAAGTFTVTASDVTTPAKTANTSAATTAN